MKTVTCPTVGCVNHDAHIPALAVPAPVGPIAEPVYPPAYCGGCGALMEEREDDDS